MNLALILLAGGFLVSLAGGFGPLVLPWTALFFLSACALLKLRLEDGWDEAGWFERRPALTLFLLCLTVYLSTFRWHGGDDIPNSMLPYAILRHGTVTFDPFPDWAGRENMRDLVVFFQGHWISTYPIAPGILALPLYVLPVLFRVAPSDVFLHNLAKIAGAAFTAASVAVCYRILEKRCSRRWACTVSLLYAFGSYAFSVSSQALYSHGIAQLGVAVGILGMLTESSSGPLLAGAGFGLALVSREDSAFFLAAAVLYHLFQRRAGLPRFAAGVLVPFGLNLAYWHACTGRALPPYFQIQSSQFGGFSAGALAAMIVAPARGLLFFFPVAVFAAWSAWLSGGDPRRRWVPFLAAACAATWVFYSFRVTWTGGNTFGNRYFSVVCMVLALFCGELEAPVRASRRIALAWSMVFASCVAVHALGAYFNWPGAELTLIEQQGAAWDILQFPAVHLFTAEGALGGLSAGPRAVVAVAFLAWSIPIGLWQYRSIRASRRRPEPAVRRLQPVLVP